MSLCFLSCLLALAPTSSAADVESEYSENLSTYAGQLEELADWCQRQRLEDEARWTRDWPLPVDPQRIYPVFITPEPGDENSSTAWRDRFRQLRRQQADSLFDLARQAADQDQSWLAYRLVWATLRENPDHAAARASLGYKQVDGHWLTKFETDKHRAGQVWDERFGWIKADHVDRYERGERYYRGSWISREQEERLRADIARGWSIPTEHFAVKTNHGLESGARLAARLERLYAVWRQMFVGYYATPRAIREMIAGRPLGRHSPRRHHVVYYSSRDEYNRELRREQSNIEITTGIYLGDKRTAYFFASDTPDHDNQYHEVTHQLFSESRPVARDIGRQANFWVVEGVACYMESLSEHAGQPSVGGLDTQRLVAARYRLSQEDQYVPMAQFCSLGMDDLQRDPRIRTLYSQATGWTHFLIHGRDGRYRDVLTDYLVAVYTGRDRAETLAGLTGADFATLDRQYREFFEQFE